MTDFTSCEAVPFHRKPRCLRLVERTNGIKFRPADQCPNEQLPGSELCAHHLAKAAAEFNVIVAAHELGGGDGE